MRFNSLFEIMITEGICMCSLSVELLLWHCSLGLLVAPLALFRWTSHCERVGFAIFCSSVWSNAACKDEIKTGCLWVKFQRQIGFARWIRYGL